jgi:uncharacterized protein involved in exopolysaccharide biosynthesis
MAIKEESEWVERSMAHNGDSRNGAVELESFDDEPRTRMLHSYFALLALRHRRLLIATSLCSLAVVFCLTYFVVHPKYEATAGIRPIGQNDNGISGLLQSTGLSNMANMSGTGIDSDIGTNLHDPDELVTILNSYTFTAAMIEDENLGAKLTRGGRSIWNLVPFLHPSKGVPELWTAYLAMSSRFNCDNSVRTGNITLTYRDKDPEFAKYVLQLYIRRLRDQLRARDVLYSTAAAKALKEAAATAGDPTMRDDLYNLAARQIKKVGTAQANADFAFAVLEKPYTPPYPVSPWVVLDTLFAGIAIPLFVFAVLVVRDFIPRARKELSEAASASELLPNSSAVSPKSRRVPAPEEDRPNTL